MTVFKPEGANPDAIYLMMSEDDARAIVRFLGEEVPQIQTEAVKRLFNALFYVVGIARFSQED